MSRETLGNRHPDTLTSINNLGELLHAKGNLAAAESLLREALEARRETLGNRHPSTLKSISNLSALLRSKGDLAAAELLCREALARRWRCNARPSAIGIRSRSAPSTTSARCCMIRATSPTRSCRTARR